MSTAWVIGGGGLLGRTLRAHLAADGTRLFQHREAFDWSDGNRVAAQLRQAVQAFADTVQPEHGACEIYWAAGRGTMGSTAADLDVELRAFDALLATLREQELPAVRDCRVALASSAGAIHAGCTRAVADELTPPSPTTPYGEAKLEQESRLLEFAARVPGQPVLIARFSTLYGAAQCGSKAQGLLTHIARSLLRNLPITIYVPFDTVRDYLAVDDAAQRMIALLRAVRAGEPAMRIVASEEPVTVAEIISIFRRVSRRRLRLVTRGNDLAGHYVQRFRFRSCLAQTLPDGARTPLPVGIAALLEAERHALASAALSRAG